MTSARVVQRADGQWRDLKVPCPKGQDDGFCTFGVNGGPHTWTATGPHDAPTVSPSIDCKVCGWHGFIVAGQLQPPRADAS